MRKNSKIISLVLILGIFISISLPSYSVESDIVCKQMKIIGNYDSCLLMRGEKSKCENDQGFYHEASGCCCKEAGQKAHELNVACAKVKKEGNYKHCYELLGKDQGLTCFEDKGEQEVKGCCCSN